MIRPSDEAGLAFSWSWIRMSECEGSPASAINNEGTAQSIVAMSTEPLGSPGEAADTGAVIMPESEGAVRMAATVTWSR